MSLESFSFCPRCGKALAERSIVDIDGIVSRRREMNEDPVNAVAREVKEELGLEVAESHLIGNYTEPGRT